MKILIVDDDEAITTVLKTAIEKEHYEIVVAETGEDGIAKAKTDGIDLILLDQVLPDISGNEVLKQLKNDEKTKNIPIIILSNFSQQELVKDAIDKGAIDYVFKYQVEPNDVIAKIKQVLEKGKEEQN